MIKVVAVSGSPRKGWNTDTMLQYALQGAASAGAETEIFYLYDVDFKGCRSCMACKLQNGRSLGRCAVKDGLSPVLEAAHNADVLILGTPSYWYDVSGMFRCFFERLLFQYLNYDDVNKPYSTLKRTAMIYTMNMPEKMLPQTDYNRVFKLYEDLLKQYFGHCQTLCALETLQVKDYSRYHLALMNAEERYRRHREVFPLDCQKAFDLGVSLCRSEEG